MALTTNLISYWKLDEASGDPADSHGSHDGVNNGCEYEAAGKIGRCFDFETTNTDNISVASHTDFDFGSGDWAFQYWVKLESTGSHDSIVKPSQFRIEEAGGELQILYWTAASYVLLNAVTTATTAWRHFVCQRRGNSFEVYLNGSLLDSGTTWGTHGTMKVTTNSMYFGGNSIYIDGFMDEIAVWDRYLTSAEVSELYNSGAGLAYPFTAAGTNFKINIGDSWKEVSEMKINIGDSWKAVTEAKINIGDSWKSIF